MNLAQGRARLLKAGLTKARIDTSCSYQTSDTTRELARVETLRLEQLKPGKDAPKEEWKAWRKLYDKARFAQDHHRWQVGEVFSAGGFGMNFIIGSGDTIEQAVAAAIKYKAENK